MNNDPGVILLIEADPELTAIARPALEENPAVESVVHFPAALPALEYLLDSSESAKRRIPDLILLDMTLPDLDGLDVLRKLKASPDHRAIPMIVLTHSTDPEDKLAAYELRINSYLVIPPDPEKFRRLIQDLGQYWMKINTYPER